MSPQLAILEDQKRPELHLDGWSLPALPWWLVLGLQKEFVPVPGGRPSEMFLHRASLPQSWAWIFAALGHLSWLGS